MNYNTANYTLYCKSNDVDYPSINEFISYYGCQQFIRNIGTKFLYIAVPKKDIDEALLEIEKVSGNILTIENIIEEYRSFGFEINYELVNEEREFLNTFHNSYYIFQLPNYKNTAKKRYYAFCMIRHFYYYQEVMINYFSLYNHLLDESDKIMLLGAIAEINAVPHTFINSIPSIIPLNSFSKLVNFYLKSGTNTSLNLRGVIPVTKDGHSNNITLENFYRIKEDFLDFVDTFKDYINKMNARFYNHVTKEYISFLVDIDIAAFSRYYYNRSFISKTLKTGIVQTINIYNPVFRKYIPYNTIINSKNKFKFKINNYSKKIVNLKLSKINRDKLYNLDSIIFNENTLSIRDRGIMYDLIGNKFNEKSFPIICKKKIKSVKKTSHHILYSKEELEKFKQDNKRRRLVYQNYYPGTNVIFHISKKSGIFYTSSEEFFNTLSLPFKNRILKKVYSIFELSHLDIGAIEIIVNHEAKTFNIININLEEINTDREIFNHYLNQINIICAD